MDRVQCPVWLDLLSLSVVQSRLVRAMSFVGDFATDSTAAEILYTP